MEWSERALSSERRLEDVCPQGVVERSKAVVCRNLFREPSPLLKFGRFEVVRTLGRGGTGIVYEAVDSLHGERVALKALHRREPAELYRLKREFRSLGEIRHPNLVKLNDLWVDDQNAYFTMDLVLGRDFVSYARSVLAADLAERPRERFESVLAQLCEGLQALHGHGKLHCDIKPSNVLVTDAGRVVLLDFGLVRDASDAHEGAAGTPGYMAPEVFRNRIVPASDWYSVGVMLRESLQGAPPESLPAEMSASFDELVRRLVSDEPAARPGFLETAAILGGIMKNTGAPPARASEETRFVGRETELAKLGRAFARCSKAPSALVVTGESGIGKSALLAEFDRAVLRPAGAFVLRGRCYERESVPYKAIDSIVDELGHHLLNAAESAPKLDGSDVAGLLNMFPALGRVKWLRDCSSGPIAVHDTREPIRGVNALKALFRSITERCPCVVFVDDLQWADEDSGRLLAELLCAEDSPRLLVVAVDRFDHADPSPTLAAFETRASTLANPLAFERVALDRLSNEEALELAGTLLDRAARVTPRLVASTSGNPFFIAEMARWVRDTGVLDDEDAIPDVSAVFDDRRARLSTSENLVVELVAAAGRPLAIEVLKHACGTPGLIDALRTLQHLRLVQKADRGDRTFYSVTHDRIAAAVLRDVDDEARVALHRRLVLAFECQEGPNSEGLIEQYAGARLPTEAARCARHAASVALSAFAFARAERLFARALSLGEWNDEEAAGLHENRAVALEQSGRGLESAESYVRAASLSTNPLVAALRLQHAARHLMHNGKYQEGVVLLRQGFRHLGLSWPERRPALVASVAWRSLLPSWRMTGLKRRASDEELWRARADFLGEAGAGIENFDPLRAVHNALLCCDAAEHTSDPVWHTRARSARALMRCLSVLPGTGGLRDLRAARDAAECLGDGRAQRDIEGALAFTLYLLGRPKEALEAAERSESFEKALPLPAVAVPPAMGIMGAALLILGRLGEARRRWNIVTHETRFRRDLMTTAWVHGNPARFPLFLAAEDADQAHEVLDRQSHLLEEHPDCMTLAFTRAVCRIEHAIYFGGRFRISRRTMLDDDVLVSGYGVMDGEGRALRARARVAAAARLPAGADKARLLRAALSDTKARRPRGPLHRAIGWLLEAGVFMQRGRPDEALALLDSAIPAFVATDAALLATCANHCRGTLIGGDEGRALVRSTRATMMADGIANPPRWVAWVACGFGQLVGSDD
jgi:serine/threonine protein kinase/tetratricopeptide (TPR) repeat protein